ncbi:response regulator [uncultured Reyranella sp.]|uniref:response regulator n=1 Tax=uncultured Reyranella sp. TaxID=735512 RepID=UPI00338D6CA7
MPLRILLVEDNPDLRREVSEYLIRRQHDVVAVEGSVEARQVLTSVAAERFNVVLCDLNLQDGDGIDLYVELGGLHPACSWLLMSGSPDFLRLAAARQSAPHLPPCTLVAKPVSLRELGKLVTAGSLP